MWRAESSPTKACDPANTAPMAGPVRQNILDLPGPRTTTDERPKVWLGPHQQADAGRVLAQCVDP
jgi:hypothetical protein